MSGKTCSTALLVSAALCLSSAESAAFVHVSKPGETLASVAEHVYGRIQYERLLVAANELDVQGGLSLVPGMRLEIPAVSYRRVVKGDTWAAMAAELLGSPKRSDVLAIAN